MVQQVEFMIPPDIEARIMSGELVQWGGIVRDHGGRIVKHLKPVVREVSEQGANAVQKAVGLAKKNPKATIVAGAVGAAAAVGVTIVAVARHVSDSRKPNEKEVHLERFNAAMEAYLESLRNQSLSLEVVKELMAAIEELREKVSEGDSNIEISGDDFRRLVELVHAYTERLGKANRTRLKKSRSPRGTVEYLYHDLQSQAEILERAA